MIKIFLFLVSVIIYFAAPVSGQECLQTIKADAVTINHAVFCSEGKTIITAGGDKAIKFWSTEKDVCIDKVSEHTGSVLGLACSPDGKYFASCGWDNTVIIWDAATKKILYTFKDHTDRVNSVCFSPDSKTLASCSDDKTILTMDVVTGKRLLVFKGFADAVTSVCYSPDGKYLAGAGWDRTIRIWETGASLPAKKLTGHPGGINSISFSPDSRTIASGSDDLSMKIWDATTAKIIKTIQCDSGTVNTVAFSPDGKFIATAGENKRIKLWNAASYDLIKIFSGHEKAVKSLEYNYNGTLLVSAGADGEARVWDLSALKYEKCMKEKLASYASLNNPRGEFETTEEYNTRIEDYKNKVASLKEDCINEDPLKIKTAEPEKITEVAKTSFQYANPRPENLSLYDADKQQFQITIDKRIYSLIIPVEDAKALKANWQSVTATAIKRFAPGSPGYDYINMKIVIPVSNTEYELGIQIDPADDAELKEFLDKQ